MAQRRAISMEEALEEERLEVMNVVEGRPTGWRRGQDTTAPGSGSAPMPEQSTVESGIQSSSPAIGHSPSQSSPGSASGTYVTEDGRTVDMSTVHKKLSTSELLKHGGYWADLPATEKESRDDVQDDGSGRLKKDVYDQEDADSSSSNDNMDVLSDDDRLGENDRSIGNGQGQIPQDNEYDQERHDVRDGTESSSAPSSTSSKQPKMLQSLLDAADEERLAIASKYKPKLKQDPSIVVTGPSGDRIYIKQKPEVHPNTNFKSRAPDTGDLDESSDSEGTSEFKRAQQLRISSSAIDVSVPHRAIRAIIRGDFSQMRAEAEQGERRIRSYIVATDLSQEAIYALEWTIGGVLRDGDTLTAIYAIEVDPGASKASDQAAPSTSSEPGIPIGEGAAAMKETQSVVDRLSAAAQSSLRGRTSPTPGSSPGTREGSRDARKDTSPEQQRSNAVEHITQTCLRLLRKTTLQVRVAVEVIHCKSPKHMITEAIDSLNPTLVVIGSRGRSKLKGVLLGSFSHYLVNKSSVPVMVARKKLHKLKNKTMLSPNVRLANNLPPFKSPPPKMTLANARID